MAVAALFLKDRRACQLDAINLIWIKMMPMYLHFENTPEELQSQIAHALDPSLIRITGEISVTFYFVSKWDIFERQKLRKWISTFDSSNLVLISQLPEVGLLAWKMGVLFFLELPLDPMSIKGLVNKLRQNHHSALVDKEKLKMSFLGGFDLIPINSICLIEGQGSYCKFFFSDAPPKTYTARIGKIGDLLSSRLNFIRPTKSLLINVNHIAQIAKDQIAFKSSPRVNLKMSTRAIKDVKKELLWIG